MKEKIRTLISSRSMTEKHSVGMQLRLFLYWGTMLLVIVASAILILSIVGGGSGEKDKLEQILYVEHQNIMEDLDEQFSVLTAQGISLSHKCSDVTESVLLADKVASLNNDEQKISTIERKMYAHLNAVLQSAPCNGAFVILEATTNTEAERAKDSRAGLYLRLANLNNCNTVDKEVTCFRGIPDIAWENSIELHNRWNLEYDISKIKQYDQLLALSGDKLADSCIWTSKTSLSGTWEDAIMLLVPMISSNGEVSGVCGIELSEMYFRLAYSSYQCDYGDVFTVLAPIDDENRLLISGGLVGGQGSSFLKKADALTIESEKNYNIYHGEKGDYLGIHTKVDIKTEDGMPLYAVTLISADSYQAESGRVQNSWIVGTLLFLLFVLFLSLFCSWHFVKPISDSLAIIQSEEDKEVELTGISEFDTLIQYMHSEKQKLSIQEGNLPPDIEELFDAFAERASTLTTTERRILKYYAEGKEIAEVAELSFISIYTVRKHNANIYRKLSVGSRDELMLYLELFKRSNRLDSLYQM